MERSQPNSIHRSCWSATEPLRNRWEQVNLLLAFALANLSSTTFRRRASYLSLFILCPLCSLFITLSFGTRGNKKQIKYLPLSSCCFSASSRGESTSVAWVMKRERAKLQLLNKNSKEGDAVWAKWQLGKEKWNTRKSFPISLNLQRLSCSIWPTRGSSSQQTRQNLVSSETSTVTVSWVSGRQTFVSILKGETGQLIL